MFSSQRLAGCKSSERTLKRAEAKNCHANKGIFQGLDANMMMHHSRETRGEMNFLPLAELRFYFSHMMRRNRTKRGRNLCNYMR